jgi:hypothetical protein
MLQFRQSAGDYIAMVLVNPIIGRSFVDIIGMESVGLLLSVALRMRMGTFGIDTGFAIISEAATIYGDEFSQRAASLSQAGSNGTHNTTSFANMPGPQQLSITKALDSTLLHVRMNVQMFVTAAGGDVEFGVNDGSTDYPIGQFFFNTAGQHLPITVEDDIAGLAAGTYTFTWRWRRAAAGAHVLNTNTDDWQSGEIREVAD